MSEKLILASASPRREELLQKLGLKFTIVPGEVDEEQFSHLPPVEMVKRLALAKAENVAELVEETLIIAADTIVVFAGQKLGKPVDTIDAEQTLRKISGGKHSVYTGVVILSTGNGQACIESDVTDVYMRNLDEQEIKSYVNTGEPLDKAGSYAIQGLGGAFVERIEGSFYTVMGLPIHKLVLMLREFSIEVIS